MRFNYAQVGDGLFLEDYSQAKKILHLLDMTVELYNDGGVYDVCRIVSSKRRHFHKKFKNKSLL